VFNFLNGTRATGQGGFLVAANAASFPALLTGNGAMAVGVSSYCPLSSSSQCFVLLIAFCFDQVLGPCGLNSPHTHPRATEIQIVTQGGPIEAAFAMENGAKVVQNIVPVGSATVFP
jgi:Cupin